MMQIYTDFFNLSEGPSDFSITSKEKKQLNGLRFKYGKKNQINEYEYVTKKSQFQLYNYIKICKNKLMEKFI